MKILCDIRVYDDDNNLRFEKNNFKVEPTVYKISEMATEYSVNFKVVLVDDIYYHKQIKTIQENSFFGLTEKAGDINA